MKRVLIVEDYNSLRRIYAHAVKEWGAEAVAVRTCDEGMELLEKECFDAVLADHVTPGELSGLDMLAAARKMSRYASIPMVMVSGVFDTEKQPNPAELISNNIHPVYKPKLDVDDIMKRLGLAE